MPVCDEVGAGYRRPATSWLTSDIGALVHAGLALAISRDTGHRSLEGTAMRMLGVAHGLMREHDAAVRHLDTRCGSRVRWVTPTSS